MSFLLILRHRGLPSEEFLDMCDYSLHSVRTRPAKVGEKLVTHDFGTGGGHQARGDVGRAAGPSSRLRSRRTKTASVRSALRPFARQGHLIARSIDPCWSPQAED